MHQWWKNLSVEKKIFGVVGVMGILIATELFTLFFAMNMFSAVRSFVAGESIWSKAQKNAVYSLNRYVDTRDPQYYEAFKSSLAIIFGDRQARIELEAENPDLNKVREGFLQGQNHPEDIDDVINYLFRFKENSYIRGALESWKEADNLFAQISQRGEEIHNLISNSLTPNSDSRSARISQLMVEIDQINQRLTEEERTFSDTLGRGSRWMERSLMFLLILAVLAVEAVGLFLIISFGRNLGRSLRELGETARQVGTGNFSHRAPIRSQDELGQLAKAINQMTESLQKSHGQKDQAESASQVKTQFLATMSHEIRTPLGVILGLVEVMKDPKLPWVERLKYMETIERTGKNLTRIINDILDISKVESGHFEIKKTHFNLSEFLSELHSMMNTKAEMGGNELNFIRQSEISETVFTDRTRLRQILINLIGNALKFTKNGSVTLAYFVRGSTLCFEVSDSGVGISPEDQKHLFRPYFQSREGSEKFEGTGLGLAFSKRLAEALGGDIVLKKSAPGQGSIFVASVLNEAPKKSQNNGLGNAAKDDLKPKADESLRIQASLAAAEPSAASAPAPAPVSASTSTPSGRASGAVPLAGKKILVVEDVIDNQLLTKLYLSRKGMKVQFANNGAEGVQKAMSEVYDLILMDMQMPVMDGYTATRKLRDEGYSKPIIAVTAHAMKEDREKCLQAGCDDYLTKPLESNALYDMISKNLQNST